MSGTLTDCITRYFLRRIRRLAVLDLYQHAAVAELLNEVCHDVDGMIISRWEPTAELLALLSSERSGDLVLSRKLGQAGRHADPLAEPWQTQPSSPPATSGTRPPSSSSLDNNPDRWAGDCAALSALRHHLPRPKASAVAVALLIARAVGSSAGGWDRLRLMLSRPAPFVVLRAPVPGFQRHCARSLEDGLIVPSWLRLEDLVRLAGLADHADRRPGKLRRRIKTIAGSEVYKISDRALSRALSEAVNSEPAPPIMLVDDTGHGVPEVVERSADLVLETEGLEHTLLAELLQICCGFAPKESLALMQEKGLTFRHLHLDDLSLIVRPGRSNAEIISALTALEDERGSRTEGRDDESEDSQAGRRKNSSISDRRSGERSAEKRKTSASDAVEIITPQEVTAEGVLCVETLSGCGEAADWAADLKLDLDHWREGLLDWSELSSRLLLAGPPGTGKTTFARALCNTLQVPLLATSVARWLEASYLGEVLQSIDSVFKAASEQRPAILFIDEIDNLGTRASGQAGGHKGHDDYWASLINRVLELMDGASKTEGVIIVAATNLPEKLDPALLRSGRLERHVQIPKPDVEALTGILAHHLGPDLATVIETAPKALAKCACLAPDENLPNTATAHCEQEATDAISSEERRITV